MPKKHSFTLEEISEASEMGNGFCIACGSEQSGVEPDARGYLCEDCGEEEVYGAEEIALMGLVK